MPNSQGDRPKTSGPAPVWLQVEFSDKFPPLFGYADKYAVIRRGSATEFVFSDSAVDRVLFRVVVDNAVLIDRLWGTSVQFYDVSQNWLAEHGVAPLPPSEPPERTKLETVTALSCNAFRLVHMGNEAVFEAHYVPPTVVQDIRGRPVRSAKAIPLVHVQTDLALILGLLKSIRPGGDD